MENPKASSPPDVMRGNILLVGDDARLFAKVLAHLVVLNSKPVSVVTVVRAALACYAKELNITL